MIPKRLRLYADTNGVVSDLSQVYVSRKDLSHEYWNSNIK